MGLRDRLKRLQRATDRKLVTFELMDGTSARFYEDEILECFVHEMKRGRRHYFGEEPGQAHPVIVVLRKVSETELERLMREHGTMLGHLIGEDEIIRGLKERPGPPVRETSPGVYE